jgi:hypothetical protein
MSQTAFIPILQQYRTKMLQNTRDSLMAAQPFAIWTLMELMTSGKSEFVREKAANDLLAHGKVMDQATNSAPGEEQAELLKKIMSEARAPRMIVEVKITDGRLEINEKPLIEGVFTSDAPLAIGGPARDDQPGAEDRGAM